MRTNSFENMTCSIASALESIGDVWAMLILRDLSLGLSKYEDLRKSTGITNATLTDRLKRLQEKQLVERRLYQVNPERHEYFLTKKGRDTILVTQALHQLGDKWSAAEGASGSPMTIYNKKTGNRIQMKLIDEKTGEVVPTRYLAVKEGPGADDSIRWRLRFNHGAF